jgi:hypothetical protein
MATCGVEPADEAVDTKTDRFSLGTVADYSASARDYFALVNQVFVQPHHRLNSPHEFPPQSHCGPSCGPNLPSGTAYARR